MICHVCQASASGQCRACLKFYCPTHGDGLCAPCAAVPAPTAPAPVPAPRRCFCCQAPAADTCDDCGKPFCNRHGASFARELSSERKLVCSECQESARAWGFLIGAVVVVAILVLTGMLFPRAR